MERERRVAIAYQCAEEERRRAAAGRGRHGDNYRGGFGSPSGRGAWRLEDAGRGGYRPGMVEENGRPFVQGLGIEGWPFQTGMVMPPTPMIRVERPSGERERPRTSGGGVKAARVWLRKVTSLESLRGRAG